LYARHTTPEYWLLDVQRHRIEVWRAPRDGQYAETFSAGPDGTLEPVLLPGLRVPLATLFD